MLAGSLRNTTISAKTHALFIYVPFGLNSVEVILISQCTAYSILTGHIETRPRDGLKRKRGAQMKRRNFAQENFFPAAFSSFAPSSDFAFPKKVGGKQYWKYKKPFSAKIFSAFFITEARCGTHQNLEKSIRLIIRDLCFYHNPIFCT